MTEHLSHIGLFDDFSSPVAFQHGVLNNDRYSSQDEGQEEVSMNEVPGAMQFPVRGHKSTNIFDFKCVFFLWLSYFLILAGCYM